MTPLSILLVLDPNAAFFLAEDLHIVAAFSYGARVLRRITDRHIRGVGKLGRCLDLRAFDVASKAPSLPLMS